MFSLEVNGHVWKVVFKYNHPKKHKEGVTTECIVFCDNVLYATGAAKQNKQSGDIFKKETGRRLSLTKVLNMNFARDVRTLFWNKYHEMANKPSRIKN